MITVSSLRTERYRLQATQDAQDAQLHCLDPGPLLIASFLSSSSQTWRVLQVRRRQALGWGRIDRTTADALDVNVT